MLVCQRRVNHRAKQKTHIGFSQHQRRHNLRRVQRLDGDGHVGVLDPKQLDGVRQYFLAERQHCQNTQLFGAVARLQIGRQPLHVSMTALKISMWRRRMVRCGDEAIALSVEPGHPLSIP